MKFLKLGLIGLALFSLLALSYYISIKPPHKFTDQEVKQIYLNIITHTGESQDALPLVIVNEPIINAYTDGKEVVVYRGIIDYAKTPDEIALILGHEVAHDMLRHVYFDEFHKTELETTIAEANADKMGAFYMMRSGYNICTARNIWKRIEKDFGDYQGLNHPSPSYRYSQLNIGC